MVLGGDEEAEATETQGWETLEGGLDLPSKHLCCPFAPSWPSTAPGEGRPGWRKGTRGPSSGWDGSAKHCLELFCPVFLAHWAQGWQDKAMPDLQLFASQNSANSYRGSLRYLGALRLYSLGAGVDRGQAGGDTPLHCLPPLFHSIASPPRAEPFPSSVGAPGVLCPLAALPFGAEDPSVLFPQADSGLCSAGPFCGPCFLPR